MASIINAVSGSGITQTADGSGVLKCQANGVTTNALAWVNFNGTGTVAIRSSYNVSSITDNGTGDYTVNFATALADANYVALATTNQNTSGNANGISIGYVDYSATALYSTTQVRFLVHWGNATPQIDTPTVSIAIFGN